MLRIRRPWLCALNNAWLNLQVGSLNLFKVSKIGSLRKAFKKASKNPQQKGAPFIGSLLKALFTDLNLENLNKNLNSMRESSNSY